MSLETSTRGYALDAVTRKMTPRDGSLSEQVLIMTVIWTVIRIVIVRASSYQNQFLSGQLSGQFFSGIVLIGTVIIRDSSYHVPDGKKETFEEMTPIFKHTDVIRNDITDFMDYGEKNKLLNGWRGTLIDSYKCEKVPWASPLLKLYLDKGSKVTTIYQSD